MTAENEEFLVAFGLEHNAGQVEALVAMSPARWKKSQRNPESAATPTSPAGAALNREGLEEPADPERTVPPGAAGADTATAATAVASPTGSAGAALSAPATAAAPASTSLPPLAPGLLPSASDPPPFVPLILIKRYLQPDQLALFEQAENRIRARLGGRRSQAEVLEEMAKVVLSAGDSRTKVRYQVYLHVDGVTGQGWLDTDRGLLPAPAEVVQEALRQGQVEVVTSPPSSPSWRTLRTVVPARPPEAQSPEPSRVDADQASTWKTEPAPDDPPGTPEEEAPPPESRKPRRRRRKAIPAGALRRVFARARGRCEDCRRRVPLDSDHLDFYSENPNHDPARMRLRCKACHSLRHEPDFASRPDWARARDEAIRSRIPADSS